MNTYLKPLFRGFLNFKKTIKGYYLKFKYGIRVSPKEKVILINIPFNKFNRYLFPIVYMLNENGFRPVLNLNANQIAHLTQDEYQALIIKNELLYLPNSKMNVVKTITLDPDYFNSVKKSNLRENVLPMSMHPLIYANGITVDNDIEHKNKVVFFAGTTEGGGHSKTQVFKGVISRYDVIDEIKQLNNVYCPSSKEEYALFNFNISKSSFLLTERHKVNFTQSELLNEMTKYSFFLALPGRGMPLCHNIVEAMYCKSVPILQDIYAQMMPNPLRDGINCLTYKDINDLNGISVRIDHMNLKEVEALSTNSRAYYDQFLSPNAITNQILKGKNNDTFYLQAEGFSIKLYDEN